MNEKIELAKEHLKFNDDMNERFGGENEGTPVNMLAADVKYLLSVIAECDGDAGAGGGRMRGRNET